MAFDGVIGDNSPSSAAFRPWAQPDAIAHVARIVAALDAVFSYGFKPEMGYERGIVSAADAYDEAAGEFGMEGRAFFFQQRRRSSRLSVSGGATPNHPGRRSSGGSGGGSLRSPTMREREPSVVAGDDERPVTPRASLAARVQSIFFAASTRQGGLLLCEQRRGAELTASCAQSCGLAAQPHLTDAPPQICARLRPQPA